MTQIFRTEFTSSIVLCKVIRTFPIFLALINTYSHERTNKLINLMLIINTEFNQQILMKEHLVAEYRANPKNVCKARCMMFFHQLRVPPANDGPVASTL